MDGLATDKTLSPVSLAIVEIIRASVFIHQRNFITALRVLRELVLGFPTPPIPAAAAIILSNDWFQRAILRERSRTMNLTLTNCRPDEILDLLTADAPGAVSSFELSEEDRAIRQYEKALDSEPDDRERAFLYFDIANRHPNPAAKAAAMLKTAVALLKASEKARSNRERFGLHKAIAFVLLESLSAVVGFSPERTTVHTTACAALYLKSTNLLPTQGRTAEKAFRPELLRLLVVLSGGSMNLFPFTTAIIPDIWCAAHMHRASAAVLEAMLDRQATTNSAFADFATICEERLDGINYGWLGNRAEDLGEARELALFARLAMKRISVSSIETILCSPLFPRDFDGFRNGNMKLQTRGHLFSHANGAQVDSDGNITFFLEAASSPDKGLFSSEDVQFIMKNGIASARLLLKDSESSANSSPLLEWSHAPRVLAGSPYLATMLQCIQTVMSFALDVEMSCRAPFRIRKCSLLARLPPSIRDSLMVGPITGTPHFTIEATGIAFCTATRDRVDMAIFGEIMMIVRAKDASPQSSAWRFAEAFSKHYDAIAAVFPEFARLAELIRLSKIFWFISRVRASDSDAMEHLDVRELAVQQVTECVAALPWISPSRLTSLGIAVVVDMRMRQLLESFPGVTFNRDDVVELVGRNRITPGLLRSVELHLRRRRLGVLQSRIDRISGFVGQTAKELVFEDSKVPLPSLYQFTRPAQPLGSVLLVPEPLELPSLSFNTQRVTARALAIEFARPEPVTSLYGQLLRTLQGKPFAPGTFLRVPEDIAIALVAKVRWEPTPGRLPPVDGQMTVLAAAQRHIFEYRNGKLPAGDGHRLSWESRMDRLANEVRWEVAQRVSDSNRSENHRRSTRDVATRGYELGLDTRHGLVFFARPLSVKEWNGSRAALGMPPIA
jgi:hypothetical protein